MGQKALGLRFCVLWFSGQLVSGQWSVVSGQWNTVVRVVSGRVVSGGWWVEYV